MFEKLAEMCKDLGHQVEVYERGEKQWHISVRSELGMKVANAHGKSKDDAAAKVLELMKPAKKPAKTRSRKRSKPAKIVATKEVEAEQEGAE